MIIVVLDGNHFSPTARKPRSKLPIFVTSSLKILLTESLPKYDLTEKKKRKNRKIDKRPTYESSRPMEAIFISQKKKERREKERGEKKEIYVCRNPRNLKKFQKYITTKKERNISTNSR